MDKDDTTIEQVLLSYRPRSIPDDLGRKIFDSKPTLRIRLTKLACAAAILLIFVIGIGSSYLSHKRDDSDLQSQIYQVEVEIYTASEQAQILALKGILSEYSMIGDTGQNHKSLH